MKKPSRKRVSSPKTEQRDNKKVRILSSAPEQVHNIIDSRASREVCGGRTQIRSLQSSEIIEHDVYEIELNRAMLIDSLGSQLAYGCTKTGYAVNKTPCDSTVSTKKNSGLTDQLSQTVNSSLEKHDVLESAKVKETEPTDTTKISSPLELPASDATAPETEIDASLVVQVSFMLIHSVPLQIEWTAKPHESGISLLMLSKAKPYVVQREIDVRVSGSVNIYVHRVPLRKDHELWKAMPPPVALTEYSVEPFVHYLRALCYTMRQYPTCSGVSHEQYRIFWPEMSHAIIEDNTFQESRYTQTIRSKDCDVVVTQREVRCQPCRLLNSALRIKRKRVPFPFTPGGEDAYTMSKDMVIEQAKLLFKVNRNLRDKIQRLQSRDAPINASSDQNLHKNSLTPQQRTSLEQKSTPLVQNTEQSPSGLTKAQEQCRDSTVTNSTPLTAVVKKLKQRLQTISHDTSSSPTTTPPLPCKNN